MRYILIFLTMQFIQSCALLGKISPAEIVQQSGTTYTLMYRSGSELDDRQYEESFKTGAENACHGHNYKILERTRTPSTLKAVSQLIDKYAFYWVIDCAN